MDALIIRGGKPLVGAIPVSGAKNAALPLMAASLLSAEPLTLDNMPELADIHTMAKLLAQHGVVIDVTPAAEGTFGRVMMLHAANIQNFTAPYDLVRTMRASVLVLGPLLARFGQAKVSLPGGCAIGTRPIDLHLHALEQMGAVIELKEGYVFATAPKGLKGAAIAFDKVSVGATENIVMAATLAEGTTILTNAAREPEVVDLCECLQRMGADMDGVGTDRITIRGVAALRGARHRVIPDRIEAGSFAAAAAATGGEVELVGATLAHLGALVEKLEEAGVALTATTAGVKVRRSHSALEGVDVMTQPYPGFPTDMQAQMMSMLALAKGASMVTETIFENRFMHVPELMRMGARVTIHGPSAMIRGVEKLSGAEVMATDLRASLSLVIAALAANGESTINRIYHLDRGYERLEEKLTACGAEVRRVKAG